MVDNNNNICSGGQVLEKARRSRRESVGCSVGSSLTQAAFGQQSNLGGRATKFSKAPTRRILALGHSTLKVRKSGNQVVELKRVDSFQLNYQHHLTSTSADNLT